MVHKNICEFLNDGDWHSKSEVVLAMRKHIGAELASREWIAYGGVKQSEERRKKLPHEDLVRRGRRKMVHRCISRLKSLGSLEERVGVHGKEVRLRTKEVAA